MSDSASGSISGFLFQFEKALVLLATLENATDTVSIERVDDVAVQDENDVVLMTIQSKHSISPNGSTFEDTSNSLWRTLQLWIQKLENGTLNSSTKFICSTNKRVGDQSLLRKILKESSEDVMSEIKDLLDSQKQKLNRLQVEKPSSGPSIKKTIKLIEFVLSKPKEFEIIKQNIQIHDQESLMERFFVAIHLSTETFTKARRNEIFEGMYGWIVNRSKAKWLQGVEEGAVFTKKEFDAKLAILNNNPAIINAVFRKKNDLASIDSIRILELKDEIFIKQISDIERNKAAKKRIIDKAILDFIYHDIEMTHIIASGNFTESDFEEFKETCFDRWQDCYDSLVLKELDEYEESDKNGMAIKIFEKVMNEIKVKFQDGISFNSSNEYIHNGTFLNLSNLPTIGWHPDWESKYKK